MRLTVPPLLGILVLTSSCDGSKPLKLHPAPGCRVPEVAKCLEPYSASTLDPDQIERLFEEGMVRCFAQEDPKRLMEQVTCLPLEMGKDKRGQRLRVIYRCPHVWLEHGDVPLVYQAAKGSDPCPLGAPLRMTQ